jgi:CspA family cold shock protein
MVREWRDAEGWGIVTSDEVPDDVFVHFSVIEMDGYKSFKAGQQIEIKVEGPGLPVEGCRYAASVARPLR